MFTSLVGVEPELFQILQERRLEMGLVLRLALLLLHEPLPEQWEKNPENREFRRVGLERHDFFFLSQKAIENSVDPNELLSYAFKEAALEVLRL